MENYCRKNSNAFERKVQCHASKLSVCPESLLTQSLINKPALPFRRWDVTKIFKKIMSLERSQTFRMIVEALRALQMQMKIQTEDNFWTDRCVKQACLKQTLIESNLFDCFCGVRESSSHATLWIKHRDKVWFISLTSLLNICKFTASTMTHKSPCFMYLCLSISKSKLQNLKHRGSGRCSVFEWIHITVVVLCTLRNTMEPQWTNPFSNLMSR